MKNKIIIMALLANGHLIQAQGIHVTSTGLTGFNTTLPPANRVEIKSGQGDPFFNNNPNTASSGLRFTNLNNTHTPFNITTNNKILSVDANGDVILVQDQLGTPTSGISVAQNGLSALGLTTVELGRLQNAASPAQLLNHREIPMGGNNILFSETPQNGGNQLTIGANPATIGKFNVTSNEITNGPGGAFCSSFMNTYANGDASAANFSSTRLSHFTNYGIKATVANGLHNQGMGFDAGSTSGNAISMAGKFVATNNNSGQTYGAEVEVSGGIVNNTAVFGTAGSGITSAIGPRAGGLFTAESSLPTQLTIGASVSTDGFATNCVAGDFYQPNPNNLPATPASTNIGVRAFAPCQPAYAGWVNSYAILSNGNFSVAGIAYLTTGNQWSGSDLRYKKDIKKLENMSDKVMQLNGYSYSFRTEEFKEKNFMTSENLGVIAQELQKVFPQLVHTDSQGYLSVNYDSMVPVLLQARKELQSKIEGQKQQIEELKVLVSALANNSGNK